MYTHILYKLLSSTHSHVQAVYVCTTCMYKQKHCPVNRKLVQDRTQIWKVIYLYTHLGPEYRLQHRLGPHLLLLDPGREHLGLCLPHVLLHVLYDYTALWDVGLDCREGGASHAKVYGVLAYVPLVRVLLEELNGAFSLVRTVNRVKSVVVGTYVYTVCFVKKHVQLQVYTNAVLTLQQ